MIRILFLGDIVGEIGLKAVFSSFDSLKERYDPDFVIVNGENVSDGRGLRKKDYEALIGLGVDCVTLGNHYRGKREIDSYIGEADRLIRPYNLRKYDEGNGYLEFDVNGISLVVSNLLGSAFINEEVREENSALREIIDLFPASIHIVDFHAESSSEKKILAIKNDGQVQAVLGTHTHVQTADSTILKNGTAYMTDVGMCGYLDGVIGYDEDSVIKKILYGFPDPMEIPSHGPTIVSGAYIEIDEEIGKAVYIEPIRERGYVA